MDELAEDGAPGERVGTSVPPRIWRRSDLDKQVAVLLDGETDEGGRRTVTLRNPDLGAAGSVAPGIDVAVNVLRPGEATAPHRHTSSVVNLVVRGEGMSLIGGRQVRWGPGDVFTTPCWLPHSHAATGPEPAVRLSFSDAPLLRRLGVLTAEEADASAVPTAPPLSWDPEAGRRVPGSEARLLGYEHLLKPVWNPIAAQHWSAAALHEALDPMDNDDPTYHARRVVMLYDPATGRAQGTVAGFVMFCGVIVPGEVHPPHRHTSVALNYYTSGSGWSIADGQRLEWEAGDLQLTPAWAPHGHANHGDATVWGYTLQDTALLYHLGALLWQEELGGATAHLGVEDASTAGGAS